MEVKESIPNKSDGPSGTEQIVCNDCNTGVTGRIEIDAAGNPAPVYLCPSCGPRQRNDLHRIQGDA